MNRNATVRLAAFAVAALIVSGGVLGLGGYSNAKNAAAVAAARSLEPADVSVHTAGTALRIEVVGRRSGRQAV